MIVHSTKEYVENKEEFIFEIKFEKEKHKGRCKSDSVVVSLEPLCIDG